jgi:hypothetical protein
VANEILDAWFNHAYKPNPKDDEAPRQVQELDNTHRTGEVAGTVESLSQ